MRVLHLNSTTGVDVHPPVDSDDFNTISNAYNGLMLELINSGANVLSTDKGVIDGFFTIVRKFDNDEEVHLIPGATKIQ